MAGGMIACGFEAGFDRAGALLERGFEPGSAVLGGEGHEDQADEAGGAERHVNQRFHSHPFKLRMR